MCKQSTWITILYAADIVLVLIIILQLLAGVLDVKGALLQGEFSANEEQIYVSVLDGLEDECEKMCY